MLEVVYLGIAASVMSLTVTASELFYPLRSFLRKKLNPESTCDSFILGLIKCPFCMGFWISVILTLIYSPQILAGWYPLDLFLTALVISAIASISSGLITWSLTEVDEDGTEPEK